MGSGERAGRWYIVPNGVQLGTFQFRSRVPTDAPLVFLGRIERIKGPHLAIEVARRTGLPLVIAGNVADEHRDFFESHIRPHLDDSQITYVGPVDDAQKNTLLGGAQALLMPVLWEEPFGIVMIEAMACGTPVIGMNRGAVAEVVEDGATGFVCEDLDALVRAVPRIDEIPRAACRDRVERLFSDRAVVDAYLRIYNEIRPMSRSAL
jgi:glycosyltransferase involved in cell wall biosynthesis